MQNNVIDLGIDLVQNSRIKSALAQPGFLEKILSPSEQEEYFLRQGTKRLEYLCGRYAAKEAIIKTLMTVTKIVPDYNTIEIKTGDYGEPIVVFANLNIKVSISHCSEYTIAEALLLK